MYISFKSPKLNQANLLKRSIFITIKDNMEGFYWSSCKNCNTISQELHDRFKPRLRFPQHSCYTLPKFAKSVENHAYFPCNKIHHHFTVCKSNSNEVIRIKLCLNNNLKVFHSPPKTCRNLSITFTKYVDPSAYGWFCTQHIGQSVDFSPNLSVNM